MTVTLGINGFGRIGRNVLRALRDHPESELKVVAINDLAPLETKAHLYEFDSVHGRAPHRVTLGDGTIDVGNGPIRVTSERDPAKLPWGDVDIALECTGFFRSPEKAALHLQNGSRRVLLSAPAKGNMKTIVYGVNHDCVKAEDRLLSNASCTTNCLAPVAHVLQEAFGIIRGHMTTVHSYTGNQPVHDRAHDDLYRARAAALSMIPTTTGAATTLGVVLPALDGRITGTAVRVPTPNVSCVDLVVETEKTADVETISSAFAEAVGKLHGVLGVTDRKLVSVDFNHDPRSAILASDQTAVQQGTLIRVLAWYDNEWGFSNRMLDTAGVIAKTL